jgi:leucyl-tRNA synthetase
LANVTEDVERLRFNRCVAHIYELANVISGVLSKGTPNAEMTAALQDAATILVQLLAPMMPHLAEECWEALGNVGLAAQAVWPKLDKALLVEDNVTYPVQVNGKKRADITVARDASQSAIEAAVMDHESVVRALEGRTPKKIIVVPLRIVNVVG